MQVGRGRPGVALVPGGALGPGPSPRLPLRRLAPMRLYTLSKRHFVLVFVVFFVCFGLTVFIGIRGKVPVWILLSFIVPWLQCFLAQPGCTHLLSPVKGPVVCPPGGGMSLLLPHTARA